MTPEEEREIAALMRAARKKARGYSDFFGWSIDRDLEEWGVATALCESLVKSGTPLLHNLRQRGRGNDPPDCEAINSDGKRVAIEVTELVCGDAIQAYKRGEVYDWADWSKERFVAALSDRISNKGVRYSKLKDGPYEGGYIILVYTDEPMLSLETVKEFLDAHAFQRPSGVERAFLLISYDPRAGYCPVVELPFVK